MAIAVAADPGAEAQEDGHLETVAGVIDGEGAAESLVDAGRNFPNPRRNGEDAVDFFEYGGAARAEEFGLPEDGELSAEVGFEIAAFAGNEIRPVKLLERLAHAAEFGADGAALGFAGVGREDEFNREALEGLLHLRRGEALRLKGGNGGTDRFAERLAL